MTGYSKRLLSWFVVLWLCLGGCLLLRLIGVLPIELPVDDSEAVKAFQDWKQKQMQSSDAAQRFKKP